MVPSKRSAVLVDGVILNGPTTDARAGEKFVEDACRLIMEEVVLKATDVSEKVKKIYIYISIRNPWNGKDKFFPI